MPVLLDPKWSKREIEAVLRQVQPKIVFVEHESMISGYDEMQIVTLSKEALTKWVGDAVSEAPLYVANKWLFVGFTSGTTGVPKGYMRTHRSWEKSFAATTEAFQLQTDGHFLAPGPFVQSLTLFVLMQSLYYGGTFYMMARFSVQSVFTYCTQVANMTLFVVPTMIEQMIRARRTETLQVYAVISSGAKWSEQSKKQAKQLFKGATLYEFYGSSEASYISYLNVNDSLKERSVGKLFPGVEICIVDEYFQPVHQGNVGQLYVKSEMIFSSYFQLPEETAAVFQNGWLITGDFAMVDEDGELHLIGRVKNMLITGGLNVYPEEVEKVFKQFPAIEEVMIVGVPDDYWGERLVACIQWSDKPCSIEELRQYGEQYLASYKLPKDIVTVGQFVYTSSGKLARQPMKEIAMEMLRCDKQ